MQFVDVKTDIAFKKIFGNEQHKPILIGFLNAVLDLQDDKRIAQVTLNNPWQPPDLPMFKETTLDIKAVDQRGITFLVEMQVRDQPWFDKRSQYYTAKAYVSQIDKGEDYPRLNQVIFIAILDFNSFEGDDYLTRHLIINQQTRRQDLRDLEFNFIELRKFKKQEDELTSIVEKWVYFIKNAGRLSLMPKSAEEVPELKDAYAQANRNTWSKNELELYDYWSIRDAADRYGREDQYGQGKLEGKIEGKIEAMTDMARKLKALGVGLDIIVQTTGLSSDDIADLDAPHTDAAAR
jgi:predicted transposase/invertase (TIGR01784 family)